MDLVFDRTNDDINKLRSYPLETRTRRETIDHKTQGAKAELCQPLSETLIHINAVQSELRMVETEFANLCGAFARKTRHTETLARDISVNEVNKEGLEKGASEAVKMRIGVRAAGKGERENTGQWCVVAPLR
jgi:hypothetical protein